jgi:hypothetical protein
MRAMEWGIVRFTIAPTTAWMTLAVCYHLLWRWARNKRRGQGRRAAVRLLGPGGLEIQVVGYRVHPMSHHRDSGRLDLPARGANTKGWTEQLPRSHLERPHADSGYLPRLQDEFHGR